MEITVKLSTLATWGLLAVGIVSIGLAVAGIIPGFVVIIGLAANVWSGVLFLSAQMERFAGKAFRHGMEVARMSDHR